MFLFLNLVASGNEKIFNIGFIDYKHDKRYSDWGRHPVDIRSQHNKESRAVDGAKLGIIEAKKLQRITKTEFIFKINKNLI